MPKSNLTRFLSDFTLGFSDGLTVPFALTAGLSSLGQTDTVIYAGLAELCAGSISMGIGGYLSARDELPSNDQANRGEDIRRGQREGGVDEDEEEATGMLSATSDDEFPLQSVEEKGGYSSGGSEALLRRHLEPLGLSDPALSDVFSALSSQPGGIDQAARSLRSCQQKKPPTLSSSSMSPASDSYPSTFSSLSDQAAPVSPVMSGLFISIGYVVGGIIPLLPYFFAATIGAGLRWSISLCLLALFIFGAGKTWILRVGGSSRWKKCVWEGCQMMILGSLAAGAAVLCVNLLAPPEQPK